MEEECDRLIMQCWNNAIYDFGTAYIFERRAINLRLKLRLLTFLGVAVPVLVGGFILTYGTQFKYIRAVLYFAGVLSLTQLIASVWALVAKWNDEYAYAQESVFSNYSLWNKYQSLAQNSPSDIEDFKRKLELVDAENQRRNESDLRQAITDKEKHMGLRAALRHFRRPCIACGVVPKSMRASVCDVCGNF